VRRRLFSAEHEVFRGVVRAFIDEQITPHHDRWEHAGQVDREVWTAAGEAGLLGTDMPKEYGGGGEPDHRYHVVIAEELARRNAHGPMFPLHNEIIGPYLRDLTTVDQRVRWLPGFCAGEQISAIAITEPDAGSDVQAIRTRAVRDGDHYVLNGQKSFISNGMLADLILVVARTGTGPRGASIFVVERGTSGLSRRRITNKTGMRAQDTADLFFADARVPAGNLIGGEGRAFAHLMRNLPTERLSIAVSAVAGAEQILAETTRHCRRHGVDGRQLADSQHSRFLLAELTTAVSAARAFTDHCVLSHVEGALDGTDAAMVKWWTTDLCQRVIGQCVGLLGPHGSLQDSPVTRAWLDTRPQTIYGGTTEIMKELIGQALL
jgi:alkylation response protein AidB-like acyl-CoA dehydrogenase